MLGSYFIFTAETMVILLKVDADANHNGGHRQIELNYDELDMLDESGQTQGIQHNQLLSVLTHPDWHTAVHYFLI